MTCPLNLNVFIYKVELLQGKANYGSISFTLTFASCLLELLYHRLFLLFRLYSTLASWAKIFYAKEKWVIKMHFSFSQLLTIFFLFFP